MRVPAGSWPSERVGWPHNCASVRPLLSAAAQSRGHTAGPGLSEGLPPPRTDSRSEPAHIHTHTLHLNADCSSVSWSIAVYCVTPEFRCLFFYSLFAWQRCFRGRDLNKALFLILYFSWHVAVYTDVAWSPQETAICGFHATKQRLKKKKKNLSMCVTCIDGFFLKDESVCAPVRITPTRSTHGNRNQSYRNNPDSSGDPQTSPVRRQQDLGTQSRLTERINIQICTTSKGSCGKSGAASQLFSFAFSHKQAAACWNPHALHMHLTVHENTGYTICICWLRVAHCEKYLLLPWCSIMHQFL